MARSEQTETFLLLALGLWRLFQQASLCHLFGAMTVANLPNLHEAFGEAAVTKAGCVVLAGGIAGSALLSALRRVRKMTPYLGGV
jgi:hypothetical protein